MHPDATSQLGSGTVNTGKQGYTAKAPQAQLGAYVHSHHDDRPHSNSTLHTAGTCTPHTQLLPLRHVRHTGGTEKGAWSCRRRQAQPSCVNVSEHATPSLTSVHKRAMNAALRRHRAAGNVAMAGRVTSHPCSRPALQTEITQPWLHGSNPQVTAAAAAAALAATWCSPPDPPFKPGPVLALCM